MGTTAAPAHARQRGQVLVLFLLSLTALMGAAGLAVDMGRFYAERRFLQNSADAAALAAGNVLSRGGTTTEARAEAIAVLQQNFLNPPNGITPSLPPPAGSEVYESGHAGDRWFLVDGIVFSTYSVRVAIRNRIPYTFARVVGFTDTVVGARARARAQGQLMPIAVRRYTHAPGSGTGTAPCTDNFNAFMDFFATASTACVGTDASMSGRTSPSPGAAFSSSSPDNDRANHGPIIPILGQGSDPDNGADFRGFIALDIRNFESSTSQVYYNGVTATTSANVLKDMEAQWIRDGGYPGPGFAPAVVPPDPDNQVGILDGNAAGIAVDALMERFVPGDEILIAIYPGITMQVPDFSMSSPGTIVLPETGHTDDPASIRVSRNNAFSGQVTLSTLPDGGDPANPLVLGTLLADPDPIDYDPDPVTPTIGSGALVRLDDFDTAGASPGIYALWMEGQAGSPYLTTKLKPIAIQIGSVTKDFTLSTDTTLRSVAPGGTATFAVNLRNNPASSFGGSVALTLEPLPGDTLPTGLGAFSFSPASVSPSGGTGTYSTLSINAGTLPPGTYQFAIRATGLNGESTPHRVTRLTTVTVEVGTAGASGLKEYVDIVGFAVMRIAYVDANTVKAYAITPAIADMNSPQLRRGQVTRLVPWTY